ncbi:hypothetical protein Patl1_03337 [Pistacia atlantica]|uniref:Uncharacterized protein n=1 Tax=Pistacia atlantica TaxID=434234 RepID=A0ACC1C7V0_9ROSI|nr:hypothetical protein Patl1_03337 [Pistacia atlantica]
MASRVLEMALILILAALFWGGATAQSNSNCSNVLATMAPCLNYLMANSSTPSTSCCSQLGAVVKSSPDCLCAALNGSIPSMGININRTIALTLPGACQVQTPSFNNCKRSGSKSTTQDSSDGGIRRVPIHFVLFLLFIAPMIAKF